MAVLLLYPFLSPDTFLPGIFQEFLYLGFHVWYLARNLVVGTDPRRTVFLQCTPADFQQPGQFLVGDEPLSLECPASGGFQFIQCLAGLFQAPEEIRHTRIVLVDELMAHNAAVLG